MQSDYVDFVMHTLQPGQKQVVKIMTCNLIKTLIYLFDWTAAYRGQTEEMPDNVINILSLWSVG